MANIGLLSEITAFGIYMFDYCTKVLYQAVGDQLSCM